MSQPDLFLGVDHGYGDRAEVIVGYRSPDGELHYMTLADVQKALGDAVVRERGPMRVMREPRRVWGDW